MTGSALCAGNQTCTFHYFLEVFTFPNAPKNGVFSTNVRMTFTFNGSGATCSIYGCSESQEGRTTNSGLVGNSTRWISMDGCEFRTLRSFARSGTFYSPAKTVVGIKLRIDQLRGYSMMLASFVESCWFECGPPSFDLQFKTYAGWAEFMDGIQFVSWS